MLSWEYPPLVVGGLSRHVHALAHALGAQGHQVTVYTRGRDGSQHEGPVRVVRAGSIPPGIPFSDLVPWSMALNLGLFRRSAAELGSERPDVIHLHDWLVAPAALGLRDLAGAPVVATIHATEHGRHGGRVERPVPRFIDAVERWMVEEADRLIVCSSSMQAEAIDVLGADPAVVDTIPNQIDTSLFRPARTSSPARRPTLLFAGRLEYEKGVQTLLHALPVVARRLPEIRLRIVGRGTYADHLHRQARQLGLDGRVRFDGFVDPDRLRDLYVSSHAVVVPSLYEPFGLVALEAMACGVPVVVSDAGGLRELVDHGATGLRFPAGDHGALARALVRLLCDQDLARRVGRAGRGAVAGRDTWAEAAARTAEVYRLAIGPREPAALTSGATP
jgi:glycogen(starch) synthase